MNPNRDLLQAYGNEAIFQEKVAGGLPLAARLAYGVLQYGAGRNRIASEEEQRAQAEAMNETLRELELSSMAQATQGLRHTRAPVFTAPSMPRGARGMGLDSELPVGMTEGSVRLAAAAGHLLKEAGIGDMLMGAARGLGKSGPAAGTVAGAFKPPRVPTMMMKNPTLAGGQQWAQSFQQLPAHARSALSNSTLAQAGVPPQMAYQLAAISAKPGENTLGAIQRLTAKGPTGTVGAAPASAMAPTVNQRAPRAPAPSLQPQPVKAPSTATPSPTPAAAPTAPASPQALGGGPPGTMDRLRQQLGDGQWKTKIPMLAAAGLGTYGAYKGLKAGLNWLSGESSPYSFNQGGPQVAHGVNQYGYPQLGAPV